MAATILARVSVRVLQQCRAFSSALFISDGSTTARPVLTPTPDLASKFQDVEKLQNNIKIRGIDVDAAALKELWKFYLTLYETRGELEQRRTEIADQMAALKQAGGEEADKEAEKLRLQGRLVRADLKNLLQGFWEVEEKLMVSCLALPNNLHPRTPLVEDKVISQHGNFSSEVTLNHLVEGKDLIDYREPHWYYLFNSAAIFDFAVMHYFLDALKSSGFSTMVPPDFCHAAVVEACGTQPEDAIILHPAKESMHLVGGASIFPFCAFYAKHTVPVKCLPVRHVVGGKAYAVGNGPGLFGTWQRSCVDLFAAVSKPEDLESQFDFTLKELNALYESLGWDFRLVYVSASTLKPWESCRASFQMFSSQLGKEIEVGSLSLSGTFLSERLPMEFEEKDRTKRFCHVLSGRAVDVTLVLACLLEKDSKNLFSAPLEPYTFGTVKIP